jgi:predicted DCC family thiol-disulfide oxidoreductase YuxK
MERVELLYDGGCGFCTRSVRWGDRHVRPTVPLRSWQSRAESLPEATLTAARDAVVLVDERGTALLTGAAAIASTLRTSPRRRWRLAGRLLDHPAIRPLATHGYVWVARHRHRLPGSTDSCDTR